MNQHLFTDLDSLSAMVHDGASVTIQKGDEADVPMALALALIRRGVRALHLVTLPTAAYPASGMMVDMLIGAGCVASIETSGVSLHELGAAPRFGAAVREQTIRVIDATCPAVYAGIQAGAKGQPFAPLRGLIGSDVQRYRDDYKIIQNPYATDDPIVIVPAINTDFAIFHAEMADSEGNIWIGRDRDRVLAGQAAERTLVTVERIESGSFFDDERLSAGLLGAMHVHAIAHAPGGCWPMQGDGRSDLQAVRAYRDAAQTQAGFDAYLARALGRALAT